MPTLAISTALAAMLVQPSPQPQPPRAAPAPVGPFIVFFDGGKSEITSQSSANLDNAAAAYRSSDSVQVTVTGNTDRAGAGDYNVGLSQRRAYQVRAYLAGRGVPEPSMNTVANGEGSPLVETPDGVAEPQNRNVQITFGPASGS